MTSPGGCVPSLRTTKFDLEVHALGFRSPLTWYLLLAKFTSAYITTVITAAAKDKANKDATAANIETLMALPECQISQRTKKASMCKITKIKRQWDDD